MEHLKIENARLKERCDQNDITLQRKDQEIKSLKGELDDARLIRYKSLGFSGICESHSLSNDLFERGHEHDTANALSDTDPSWIQVKVNDLTDHSSHGDTSWASVDANDAHCWMPEALFKKVENDNDVYVEAHALVEGSLVRAADGDIVKIVDPPKRHETDIIILLHTKDAKLPVTPKHRVPVLTPDGKAQDKYAQDLQQGDVIFVDGTPTKLTMKEEIAVPEKREVVQIRFVPDKPVPVFMAPPSIETKGHKRKKLRRGIDKTRHRFSEDLKTEGYLTD